jgi:hypothetical protein
MMFFHIFSSTAYAEEVSIQPVHYAYSNYLGSGVYRTSGQNVTLINLPFNYELDTLGKTTYGLRLPISLGFFNFDFADIPELDFPSSVGTFTFTPGIQFNHQATEQLVIESYIDYGFAKNLTTNKGVTVYSAGVSTLYYFPIAVKYDAIWVNRIYYAAYDGSGSNDSYGAIETGLDVGLPLKYQIFNYKFQPRIFTSSFWYFNEVNFFNPSKSLTSDERNTVNLSNSFELGLTLKFDKIIGYSWAGIERLGLSYRYSDDFSAFRLLFSFPL